MEVMKMAKKEYEYHAIVLEDDFEDKIVTFEDEHTAELYSKAKRDEGKMSYAYKKPKPTCIGCKKHPEDILEYQGPAEREGITPSEWVRQHEAIGCWGSGSRDKFYCTSCYIKAGMPLRKY
jgi:hypothetical protein